MRATELLEPLTLELWLLTHPDLRHTARVKTLLSFLHGEFSRYSALFEGRRPRLAAAHRCACNACTERKRTFV